MHIVVPGTPLPLQRPRAFKCGNSIRMYNSQKKQMLEFSSAVEEILPHDFHRFPITQNLLLDIRFHMPIPKSTSKKKTVEMELRSHCKKPDLTNLVKFVEDSLNGIVWDDDSQISQLKAKKFWSGEPKTIIDIIPLGNRYE